jgi:hypothetical protein
MASPDQSHHTTKRLTVESNYPNRPAFFAHRFTRLLFKSCAAQAIGHHAVLLAIHVAHTEDAARYRGPVMFWNSQLVETLGLSSDRALRLARERCETAGLLRYQRGTNRQVGRYWVTIPAEWEVLDDSPIESSSGGNGGANTGAKDHIRAGISPQVAPDSSPENRRNCALPSNPCPIPDPSPIPEDRGAAGSPPKKVGRSPPSLAEPPFEDIKRHWNESLAVSHTLTEARRNKIKTRWKDATFRERWQEAIDRISASDFCRGLNDRGWKADLDWFLHTDTLTKVLEGKYDNRNTSKASHGDNSAARTERQNSDAFNGFLDTDEQGAICQGDGDALQFEANGRLHNGTTRRMVRHIEHVQTADPESRRD